MEDNEHDILAVKRAWQENKIAIATVVKPMDFESLPEAVRSINSFWQPAEVPEDNHVAA